MKKIKLSGKRGIGKFALVDDEDYEELRRYKWNFAPNGYAVRDIRINGIRTKTSMHRDVNKTIAGLLTDHINGNKLDNRRENLRSCTAGQNICNSKKRNGSTYKYKGVYKDIRKTKTYWRARINIDGKQIFYPAKDELDAALKYNQLALKHYGKFARLNVIKNDFTDQEASHV